MSCSRDPVLEPGLDGVRTTRRLALRGSLALPALWMLTRGARAWPGVPAGAADGVDEFLREWAARAAELVATSRPNEDAAVHELCAGLARLGEAFPPKKRVVFENGGMTTGPVFAEGAFLVVELELEPGAVIRAHNHVGWSFVTLAVRGEATARHFEPESDAPDPGELGVDFRVREVSRSVLVPGRTTSLTRTRANIHGFRAGEQGATLLDFGIHFPDPGAGPSTFSALEYDAEALDPARGIHRARWLGNIYAKKKR